ncbi:PstS family phosphate ABC transporter substrate-binding protein [Steroidobacter sp.]|uniref:PstS family phosphate ABC transporter substrate-binding protein n=1 Tax=Steroidobacter sp. TaxID=1978227 RepID=UPI001A4B35DE|nr:substrate-binding domain-containing protein [Steroidobacter sp.]MBL8269341.1 substrate-binding domain-containing protein [Steroidobacter sp.]
MTKLGHGAAVLMLSIVGTAAASDAPMKTVTRPAGSVEWLLPPVAPATPQTEAEKERGRMHGRTLPQPELLQPSVDGSLPAYRPASGALSGKFSGGSSDVLVELVQLWFERFKAQHREVQLGIVPPYAGSLGTKELIKESADFVFVSRELKPEDIKEFKERFGYAPTSIPIAGGSYRHYGFLDAMGFFVHPDNPLAQLDFKQIDALFSSTRHRGGAAIRTWGQLGLKGEWANQPIHVYGVQPWNGFEEFIRQRILSTDTARGEWRTDMNFEKVVFPLAADVANDRYAIGYSGLAYIDAPVKMLPLSAEPGGPALAPTYENVALAKYPLSRLVFFNVNKVPGKPLPPALDAFVKFMLSRDGQQAVRDHAIFLPLRAEQAALARKLLEP